MLGYHIFEIICNSNWTEWGTIRGVIARVISESNERKARGRFEKLRTPLLPELYDARSNYYNKFLELKMSFENFFYAKTSVALFVSVENCAKHCQ